MPNMASRRSYKNLKQNSSQDYTVLKLNDVLCPICRGILIEPVTLPCSHGYCLSCFKGTVENANLVCPLCRIRIGSWLRKTKKESNLINVPLWEAIKHNYAQHVKNKLEGIDENLEEESRVIVSLPGEIRKEYEIQKKKDDDELRRIREAENKASEELINKIKQEDDYQKAVMEEKIRLDEEIAKRIAAELAVKGPSTSKSTSIFNNISKTIGPMDRFVRRENETVTSQTINIKEDYKPAKKFAEKEYTCRVLYLDRRRDNNDVPKTFSPIIKKKIQQIQKSYDGDQLNDSFESFEADMRYFKPIDNKFCPTTVGKPPIKVPCRKAYKNGAAKILSPSGTINFSSNCLESAFARISMTLPTTVCTTKTANIEEKPDDKTSPFSYNFKRRHSIEDTQLPHKIFVKDNNPSPILDSCEKMKFVKISYDKTKKFPEKRKIIKNFWGKTESPPFYGFDNSFRKRTREIVENETHDNVTKQHLDSVGTRENGENVKKLETARTAKSILKKDLTVTSKTTIRKNGNLWMEDESYKQKLLQEKADLELAKKLQKEFDTYAHYTRSSRKVGRGSIHRQTTLDQILTGPYRVK